MGRYKTAALRTMPPADFRRKIDSFLAMVDPVMEGYRDPAVQRDLSIRFHWGHDHDFGDFQVGGRMGTRHIDILSFFMDHFGALPADLAGKRILDIGCWTGGTSLLLAAMGAEVVAIEEVRKYVEALRFLGEAFAIRNLQAYPLSLYDLTDAAFQDRFDFVLFSGVIYHLTDPVLGARIAFNTLKDGGSCLVETLGSPGSGSTVEYWGPSVAGEGSREDLSRAGWNWFVPTPPALQQMLLDVGFAEVETTELLPTHRICAVARRETHRDMTRAGLSAREIR